MYNTIEQKLYSSPGWDEYFSENQDDKNRESALKKAHEVFGRAKIRGRLPDKRSRNKQESSDGHFLSNLRCAKKATGVGRRGTTWYPEINDIAEEYGFPSAFDSAKERILIRFKKMLSRIKHNGIPSLNSKNKQEKSDAIFVVRLRLAKNGKGNCVWYPEYDNISKEYKLEHILDTQKEQSISRLKEVLSRIKINGIPRQRSTDKQEKSDAGVVTSLRLAKNGKGNCVWYPEYDNVIKEYKGEYIFR